MLITCGVQEALFLTLQTLAGDGDEVIVTGPALPEDLELVRSVGAAARVAPAGDELRIDVDRVQALVKEHTRLIVLRSPTAVGEVIPDDALEQLGKLVLSTPDLRIVTIESGDVLARRASSTAVSGRSTGSRLGPSPSTTSGTGLEAWRVGYLAAQRALIGDMRRLKQELSICSPASPSTRRSTRSVPATRMSWPCATASRPPPGGRRGAGTGRACVRRPEAGIYVFVKPPPALAVPRRSRPPRRGSWSPTAHWSAPTAGCA